MHCQCPRVPKLTQLQSRFAACLGASMTLMILYFILTSPRLAYAQSAKGPQAIAGLDIAAHDHNWFRLRQLDSHDTGISAARHARLENRQSTSNGATNLPGNNSPGRQTVSGGQVGQWIFTKEMVTGPHGRVGTGLPGAFQDFYGVTTYIDGEQEDKRQDTQAPIIVYLSINTCSQPANMGASPPQLILYASTASQAGPGAPAAEQLRVPLVEGYAKVQLASTGDVRIAIEAPALPSGATGRWTYSVAASIDDYFHQANIGLPPLYLVDTDTSSALLITDNVTQADPDSELYTKWMSLSPPFSLFYTANGTASINGLRNSYCALDTASNVSVASPQTGSTSAASPVQMSMINRGLGRKPKQQFYLRGLQGGRAYQAILAMTGNSTAFGPGVVGGGGRVYGTTNFTTKSDGNCALIYNLTFCNEVAYSVPSNPATYPNASLLSAFYDSYAAALYTNFTLSLQLIPCNTEPAAQYSLTKTCDDCAAAYKSWVCSVSIPRCVDFSASVAPDASPHLVYYPRNVAQPFPANGSMLPDDLLASSWNPMSGAPSRSSASQQVLGGALASRQSRVGRIDDDVRPGPYRELLPCEDLCYDLVRSCPAALGFGCPPPGRGLEAGYAKRDARGRLSCNYAGAVDLRSGATRRRARSRCLAGVGVVLAALMAF